jgi:hypothetical protein
MGREDSILNRVDRAHATEHRWNPEKTPHLQQALDRAAAYLKQHRTPMSAALFSKYDPAQIERDQRRALDIARKNAEDVSTKHSYIAEGIVAQQSAEGGWLGKGVEVLVPSLHDDVMNGIDMIALFTNQNGGTEDTAFAIDVTYSKEGSLHKLDRVRSSIDKGTLTKIDYFHSPQQHFTGEKRQIPRMVFALPFETLDQLAKQYAHGLDPYLAKHPAQQLLLEQACFQLEQCRSYALQHETPHSKALAPIFDRTLARLRPILLEKQKQCAKDWAEYPVLQQALHKLKQDTIDALAHHAQRPYPGRAR